MRAGTFGISIVLRLQQGSWTNRRNCGSRLACIERFNGGRLVLRTSAPAPSHGISTPIVMTTLKAQLTARRNFGQRIGRLLENGNFTDWQADMTAMAIEELREQDFDAGERTMMKA